MEDDPRDRRPPAMLSREEAAAYVGVSATLFDEEVAAGMAGPSPPAIRSGAALTSAPTAQRWDVSCS